MYFNIERKIHLADAQLRAKLHGNPAWLDGAVARPPDGAQAVPEVDLPAGQS